MAEAAMSSREDDMAECVNILYQSSGTYAPIMGVSLTSLFQNNNHIQKMDVYIIDGGIGEEDKLKINELCELYHRRVFFIPGSSIDDMLSTRGVAKWRNSYAVYYKLYALELIEKPLDRLLALDADTIINKAIDSLYFADMEGNTLGMVQDFMPQSYMKAIGMRKNDVYYNSGMVLFDVEQWKSRNCHNRIELFLKANLDYILYADQDVISIVLQKEIKKLSICFNYYSPLSALCECLHFNLNYIYFVYGLGKLNRFYTVNDLRIAENEAVVYHYEGNTVIGRPWEIGEHYSIFDIWDCYKDNSLWRDMNLFAHRDTSYHAIEKKLNGMLPIPVYAVVYKAAYDLYWYRVFKTRPNLS